MNKKMLASLVKAFCNDEQGLTIVEYAVAASLITGFVSFAFVLLGGAAEAQLAEITGYIL
jgi:pilus assembly protein Flp/PilA